jgi:ribosomal protein L37AE/L43A
MLRNQCPCCGSSLLRHARPGGVYWFCTSCRQDMPLLMTTTKLPRLDSLAARTRPVQPINS